MFLLIELISYVQHCKIIQKLYVYIVVDFFSYFERKTSRNSMHKKVLKKFPKSSSKKLLLIYFLIFYAVMKDLVQNESRKTSL